MVTKQSPSLQVWHFLRLVKDFCIADASHKLWPFLFVLVSALGKIFNSEETGTMSMFRQHNSRIVNLGDKKGDMRKF